MKIYSLIEATIKIAKLKKEGKKIVLAGGCFDLLHIGHLKFLQAAKKQGDILVIAIEADQKVRILKGQNRPIFNQKKRAEMLSGLSSVDLVILLPVMIKNEDYQKLLSEIKPEIIAVTNNDPLLEEKKKMAENNGGKVIIVIKRIAKYATTKIIENCRKQIT